VGIKREGSFMEKYGLYLGIFIVLFGILSGLIKSRKSKVETMPEEPQNNEEYMDPITKGKFERLEKENAKLRKQAGYENNEEYMDPITKGKFERLEKENAKLRKQAGYARHSDVVDTAARIYVFKFKFAVIGAIILFILMTITGY